MGEDVNGYTTIKLPDELADKIDQFILVSDDGYTSRTDLIKTALREFFQRKCFGGEHDKGKRKNK